MQKVPVTVLSGFLGAGKTTVLNHILNQRGGLKVAVIVNDMSEVNIDAKLVETGGAALSKTDEKLVEMSNGCICCTLREDLLIEVAKLAREGRFDCILIESTGISEPLPVAETFTFEDETGRSLSDIATLDTMVTVVDGLNFLLDYKEAAELNKKGIGLDENDDRTVVELLIDQVEFANVVIINKVDLIDSEDLLLLKTIIHKMNPDAKIIFAVNGQINPSEVLKTGLFDFERAASNPGWLKEIRGEHQPETETYGISSFVFRSERPFHPGRFAEFLEQAWSNGIIRAKGFVWLASRSESMGILALASRSCHLSFSGEYDGGGQEIVLIGYRWDQKAVHAQLTNCLLTDAENNEGLNGWANYSDPFPEWTQPPL